jgi:hypothetical protein
MNYVTSVETAPRHDAGISMARGIAAMTAPYATLARVFEGFRLKIGEYGRSKRGGEIRSDKTPKMPSEKPGDQAPGYHVESSFSDERRAYVGATIAALNTLAQGRVISQGDSRIPDLSALIEHHFRRLPPSKARFSNAITASLVDLYTEVGQFYPNLTPALAPMLKAGGIEGTKSALTPSVHFFDQAITGEFDRNTAKAYLEKLFSRPSFRGGHSGRDSSVNEYEIWCSGVSFGKTIMRQAQEAALRLAEDTTVRESYNSAFDLSRRQDIDRVLKRHVSRVASQVRKQHAPPRRLLRLGLRRSK